MEAFDLGPAHTVCLNILYEQPEGTTKTNLAQLCGVDKAQISRVVSELQEKELVVASPRQKGYKQKIALTDKGHEVAQEITGIIIDINEYVSQSIPQEQIDLFYTTFGTICNNLKKAEKVFNINTEVAK